MNMARVFLWAALILFGTITTLALLKKGDPTTEEELLLEPQTLLFSLEDAEESSPSPSEEELALSNVSSPLVHDAPSSTDENALIAKAAPPHSPLPASNAPLPDGNLISQLFTVGGETLPFVETVTYKSKVPWLKKRSAWLVDYANHYQTSRYFISRSLSGGKDYYYENYANNDRFNVLRKDRDLRFHLVVDISRNRLWLYALDGEERYLLKTYTTGLGRPDTSRGSGYLTPTGTYSLGSRVATYKPGIMDYYNREKVEMIRVFGTRWIPFEKELENCTAPAKGLGLHGLPWKEFEASLREDPSSLGKYQSDGCIRLAREDIEEIFSIVIARPTTIDIVHDFHQAKLPGKEISYSR